MLKREYWIDNIKILACILVVLGHFFQSMVKSNIISQGVVYNCFLQTITCFHVALFFLCSGFLYQKNSHVRTVLEWKQNVFRKLYVLLIPYTIFTSITWGLKMLFPSDVNTELGRLLDVLLINPTAPYWYLITLFIFFIIMPTIDREKEVFISIGTAILLKIISLCMGGQTTFILTMIPSNLIWFVMGMVLCKCKLPHAIENNKKILGPFLTIITFFICIVYFREERDWIWMRCVIGILFCLGITFCFQMFANKCNRLTGILSKYTMPVYLLHTIFAATFRSLLFKLHVMEPEIHILFGIIITFAGPILATKILVKSKYLKICIYPNKFINNKKYR